MLAVHLKDEDFTVLGAIIILKGHLSLTDAFKLSNYDIAFLDFPGTLQVFPRSPLVSHMAPHYESNISDSVAKTLNFLHRLLTITDVMLGKYVRHEVSLQKLFVEELVSSD